MAKMRDDQGITASNAEEHAKAITGKEKKSAATPSKFDPNKFDNIDQNTSGEEEEATDEASTDA